MKKNDYINIGHALEALIRKRGYRSNLEFTIDYGVKYASFSRYISGLKQGKRGGYLETLVKYLEFLDSSLFELLNFFESYNNQNGNKKRGE